MRMMTLASGSSGNCIYIGSQNTHILIDSGITRKRIMEGLAKVNIKLSEISAIFVTHEHSDHTHGVGVLARRYGMDVYANEGTWQAMADKVGKIPLAQKHIIAPNTVKDLGDMDIESFAVSHDAAQPQFYQVHHNNKTFCIITDTGYVSDRVAGTIRNADAYVMECNHDTEMLRMGPYSWPLKQRILGDEGHLSNEEGADALMSVVGRRTKEIFLGHRSQHNNMRSLAHLTVASLMEQHDFGVDHDFKLQDAEPEEPSKLMTL